MAKHPKRDPEQTYSYGGRLYGPGQERSVADLDKASPLAAVAEESAAETTAPGVREDVAEAAAAQAERQDETAEESFTSETGGAFTASEAEPVQSRKRR